MKKTLFILLQIMGVCHAFAQAPEFGFLSDSLGIGERGSAYLVYHHNGDSEVFFPDENYNFKPFELVGKTIFPTVTRDSLSTDSVIYHLQTFATDELLKLSLPIWLSKNEDSSAIWSNVDTLFFRSMIPDSLLYKTKLISNPGVKFRRTLSKWSPKVWIPLLVLLLAGLIAVFFKTRFSRAWELYQLNKRHRDFHKVFRSYIQQYEETGKLSAANVLWREYMERLEKEPFSSLSAIEIESMTENEQLGRALREVESSLFGGRESERIPLALQILSKYARERFRIRKVEFKKRKRNG